MRGIEGRSWPSWELALCHRRRVKINAKFIAYMQDPAGIATLHPEPLRILQPHVRSSIVTLSHPSSVLLCPVTSSLVDELAKAFWCPAPPDLQGSTWATSEFLKMEVP